MQRIQMSNIHPINKTLLLFVLGITVFTFAARFFPHLPNFTPIGAFALFTGVYLAPKTKWALCLPLLILLLSDLFIGFYEIQIMALVYGSFLMYGALGLWISQKKNPVAIVAGTFGGALIFFLITNFGVWAFSSLYEQSFAGLMNAYVLAIPFFRPTLLGDLFYTGLFFGAYEVILRYEGSRIFSLKSFQKVALLKSVTHDHRS